MIDRLGPILGIVAFVGLVVLVFLLFMQAREIRRLREWAGRAPERAREAAEASLAAADARGAAEAGEPPRSRASRLDAAAAWLARTWGAVRERLSQADRRLPVDGRYLMAVVGIAVLAALVLTGGFGLFGGNGGGGHGASGGRVPKPGKTSVAVLNGTQTVSTPGVPGLASQVESQVVKPAGYEAGPIGDAGASYAATVVMFKAGHEDAAKALATAVKPKLGKTPTKAMTGDIHRLAQGAPLALVVGLDDAHFAGG